MGKVMGQAAARAKRAVVKADDLPTATKGLVEIPTPEPTPEDAPSRAPEPAAPARLRKDGSPARKPGPRPRAIKHRAGNVVLRETMWDDLDAVLDSMAEAGVHMNRSEAIAEALGAWLKRKQPAVNK